MRAAVCRELSGPAGVVVETVPRAPRAPGKVQIAVRAAGVGFPDYLLTQGKYQLKLDPPFTPGMELAGEVTEAGGAFAVGDRVLAMIRSGAFAEEAVLDEGVVFPLPPALSFEEGAGFLVPMRTAYHALVERAALAAGETVLVLGATGGVGLAAVQLAKRLGAKVIAVGSSAEKLATVKELGADHVVVLGEDLVTQVRALVPSVDVVLDPVGGALAVQAARLLGWGGRFLIVGFASGEIPSFAANQALLKGYAILGVRAGEAGRRDPVAFRASTAKLLAWSEHLRPHVSHVLPLAETADALRVLERRAVVGRVILTM